MTIASSLWKFQPNRSKEVAKDIYGIIAGLQYLYPFKFSVSSYLNLKMFVSLSLSPRGRGRPDEEQPPELAWGRGSPDEEQPPELAWGGAESVAKKTFI